MLIYRSLKIVKLLFILYIFFIHLLYIYFIYIFIIYDLKTFKYEKCILMKKTIFFLKIKKYRKLNKIFKSIQETKLWKISLKSVCISRQCSFISKKRKGLERWEREEGFRGRFDFDFLHFLAHFSSGSQFLSGRHIEQSIPDIRREKGEEDVAGSLLRST